MRGHSNNFDTNKNPLWRDTYSGPRYSTGDFCLYKGKNCYLTMFGYITEEEFEMIDELERQWKASLKNFDPLEMFPEAKKLYREQLKREIDKAEEDLARAAEIEKEGNYILDTKCSSKDRWFWQAVLDVIHVNPLREGREKLIKKNRFLLSNESKPQNGVTESLITNAKSFLVSDIIEINRSGFALCPLHTEDTPSLKYYPKTNTWYCYGCHEGGDTINLVMEMHNLDFVSAVKKLNDKTL